MKKVITTVLIATVLFLISKFTSLPWFSSFILLVPIGAVLGRFNGIVSTFVLGSISTIVAWGAAYSIGFISDGTLLVNKMGETFSISPALLIIVSLLIAGLLGGLATYTGALFLQLKKTPVSLSD